MKYDPDIHHRRSVRLKEFDYANPNGYYITINVRDMRCLFGEVVDGKMVLNRIGRIVENEWKRTEEIRKEVRLDEFVVMPNHMHSILVIIDKTQYRTGTAPVPLSPTKPTFEQFGKPTRNSIPTIIRSFKAATSRRIKKVYNLNNLSVWKRGYYEHVLRNERELERAREYIVNNPMKWEIDRFNSSC